MKKLIYLIIALFNVNVCHSQFVFIPDINFRNFIKNSIDVNAISGTMLDTTNINVISRKGLSNLPSTIFNLEGIQYFDSLQYLSLYLPLLNNLPAIPKQVTQLFISSPQLTTVPALPESLLSFTIEYTPVTSLPTLPSQLVMLIASNDSLITLPAFPTTLTSIIVYNNQIDSLPTLPPGLIVLEVSFNNIPELPALPNQLINLFCASNLLTTLPALPSTIQYVYCDNNAIDSLPVLPDSLFIFSCSGNEIQQMPSLPLMLYSLNLENNPLISFPALNVNLRALKCRNTLSCLPVISDSLQYIDFDGCLSNHPYNLHDFFPLCEVQMQYIETPDSSSCNDSLLAPPFMSYLWNTGDTTAYLAGICRGIYTCTANDSNGCIYNSTIDVTDTTITLSAISSPEKYCDNSNYSIDLNVKGGTPPYQYYWTTITNNATLQNSCITCQDLLNIDFNDYYPEGMDLRCVVTDASGRIDSVVVSFFPNYYPDVSYYNVDYPVCPAANCGAIQIYSSVMSPSGPPVNINQDALSPGTYIYTQPYGYGCQAVFEVQLSYLFQNCDSAVDYVLSQPDCGACNGGIDINPKFLNGFSYDVYPVSIIEQASGNVVMSGQLCNESIYIAGVRITQHTTDYDLGRLIHFPEIGCTTVYPGDANNDGVANNLDLLSIGIAFNDTGTVRVDTTVSWDGKYAQDWMSVFIDSVNYKHADCNGNGIINDSDTSAIIINYGLTHNRSIVPSAIYGAPSIYVDLPDTIFSGSQVNARLIVGDALNPCVNLYGLAFTVIYNVSEIIPSSILFIPDSGWYGNASDFLNIEKNNVVDGYLETGISRRNHISKSGYGSIGTLQFEINPSNSSGSATVSVIQS
ncbi:MAG: hypothetical protein ABI772_01825, partial [Bacteroidota bacterium]